MNEKVECFPKALSVKVGVEGGENPPGQSSGMLLGQNQSPAGHPALKVAGIPSTSSVTEVEKAINDAPVFSVFSQFWADEMAEPGELGEVLPLLDDELELKARRKADKYRLSPSTDKQEEENTRSDFTGFASRNKTAALENKMKKSQYKRLRQKSAAELILNEALKCTSELTGGVPSHPVDFSNVGKVNSTVEGSTSNVEERCSKKRASHVTPLNTNSGSRMPSPTTPITPTNPPAMANATSVPVQVTTNEIDAQNDDISRINELPGLQQGWDEVRKKKKPTFPAARSSLPQHIVSLRMNTISFYVSNLPPQVTKSDIRQVFEGYGEVEDIFFPLLKINQKLYIFVRFAKGKDPYILEKELKGIWMGANKLYVSLNKPAALDGRNNLQTETSYMKRPSTGNPNLAANGQNAENCKTLSYELDSKATDWLANSILAIPQRSTTTESLKSQLMGMQLGLGSVIMVEGGEILLTYPNADLQTLLCTQPEVIHTLGLLSARPWHHGRYDSSRAAWLQIKGTPLHGWCPGLFKKIAESLGEFVMLDKETENRTNLQYARALIRTTESNNIDEQIKVVIADEWFNVRVSEERHYENKGKWKSPNQVHAQHDNVNFPELRKNAPLRRDKAHTEAGSYKRREEVWRPKKDCSVPLHATDNDYAQRDCEMEVGGKSMSDRQSDYMEAESSEQKSREERAESHCGEVLRDQSVCKQGRQTETAQTSTRPDLGGISAIQAEASIEVPPDIQHPQGWERNNMERREVNMRKRKESVTTPNVPYPSNKGPSAELSSELRTEGKKKSAALNEARQIWEFGQEIGVTAVETDEQTVSRLVDLEAQDCMEILADQVVANLQTDL